MPTYEFRCPDGTIIERIFKMSDVPDEIPTPDGQGVATRIMSGAAGLVFKGSGFYITDYGKDGKKDQRSATKSSGSDSAGSGSSESKSADSAKPASDAKPASAPAPSAAAPSSPPKKS